MARVTGLSSYARLLTLIGKPDSANGVYEQMLGFKLPQKEESAIHMQVGLYRAKQGERDLALRHLEQAARLDPSNRPLQELIEKMRKWNPTP